MSLKVKVDEDLPGAIAERLRATGYDAHTVHEEGYAGSPDGELWTRVQAEGRFLVTADKGFADLRVHPPGTHRGVLLLRPDRDGIPSLIELLEDILASTALDRLAGATAVATPRGLRVRRGRLLQ